MKSKLLLCMARTYSAILTMNEKFVLHIFFMRLLPFHYKSAHASLLCKIVPSQVANSSFKRSVCTMKPQGHLQKTLFHIVETLENTCRIPLHAKINYLTPIWHGLVVRTLGFRRREFEFNPQPLAGVFVINKSSLFHWHCQLRLLSKVWICTCFRCSAEPNWGVSLAPTWRLLLG